MGTNIKGSVATVADRLMEQESSVLSQQTEGALQDKVEENINERKGTDDEWTLATTGHEVNR